MQMMTPMGRAPQDGWMKNLLPQQPCGGVNNGFVHFQSMPGSRNLIGWNVAVPSKDGTCKIRIGLSTWVTSRTKRRRRSIVTERKPSVSSPSLFTNY